MIMLSAYRAHVRNMSLRTCYRWTVCELPFLLHDRHNRVETVQFENVAVNAPRGLVPRDLVVPSQ